MQVVSFLTNEFLRNKNTATLLQRSVGWETIAVGIKRSNVPSNFFLQVRGLATSVSRKFLHALTIAGHFKSSFFCDVRNKNIYNEN
jgi:hypothetical protein